MDVLDLLSPDTAKDELLAPAGVADYKAAELSFLARVPKGSKCPNKECSIQTVVLVVLAQKPIVFIMWVLGPFGVEF